MYSQSERLAILYLECLNSLKNVIKDIDLCFEEKRMSLDILKDSLKRIITIGVENIEDNGGTIRSIEDGLLTLISLNRIEYCSKL